jgi:hypothetical protein
MEAPADPANRAWALALGALAAGLGGSALLQWRNRTRVTGV